MIYGSTAVRPLMSSCLLALCRRTAGSSSILLARCRMCEYTAKLFGAMPPMASTSLVEERILVPPPLDDLWFYSRQAGSATKSAPEDFNVCRCTATTCYTCISTATIRVTGN